MLNPIHGTDTFDLYIEMWDLQLGHAYSFWRIFQRLTRMSAGKPRPIQPSSRSEVGLFLSRTSSQQEQLQGRQVIHKTWAELLFEFIGAQRKSLIVLPVPNATVHNSLAAAYFFCILRPANRRASLGSVLGSGSDKDME